MARDRVELLVQLVGQDGVTKILDAAATEALRLDQRLKKGQKTSKGFSKSIKKVGTSWSQVTVGFNQGLELLSKMGGAANAVLDTVRETVQARQLENRFVNQLNVSVQSLAEASGFNLSDLDLKRFALEAKNAGISMDQFRNVLDVTLRASTASGKAFEDVFEGLFKDTIVGASDSYLEQLGIVADMGTVTEKYAKDQGIAKDAIDKNVQSQAMLKLVLGEVSEKYDGVSVDGFVSELKKAERAANEFKKTIDTAIMFAVKDFIDFVDRGSPKSKNAFQEYKDTVQEIEDLHYRLRKQGPVTDRTVQLFNQQVEQRMQRIGELAKQNEDVLRDVGEEIKKQARFTALTATSFNNAESQANAYNAAVRELGKAYGLAEHAEFRLTTHGQQFIKDMQTQKEVVDSTSTALGALDRMYRKVSDTLQKLPDPNDSGKFFDESGGLTQMGADALGVGAEAQNRAKKRKRQLSYEQRQRIAEKRQKAKAAKKAAEREAFRQAKLRNMAQFARTTPQRGMMLPEQDSPEDAEYIPYLGALLQDAKRPGMDRRAIEDHATTVIEQNKLMLDSFNALAEGTNKFADALRGIGFGSEMSAEKLEQLSRVAAGLENLTPKLQEVTKTITDMSQANDKSAGNIAAGVSTITAAALEGAAGFVKGEKEKASIMAAAEVARAGTMFALFAGTLSPQYAVAGTMHLANAGLYAAIAGGAFKGGGSGGGAAAAARGGSMDIPQLGQLQQAQGPTAPSQIVVNMDGAIVAGANRRKTANDLGDLIEENMRARR